MDSTQVGPSVVRIEAGLNNNGKVHLQAVESDLQRNGASGVWFPKVCTYTRVVDGKSKQKEVTEIQVVSHE